MINTIVIGCGNIAPTYLYTLKKHKDANVVAVVDTDIKKAEELAKTFKVNRAYTDYLEALDFEDLDAAVICTPHYLHCEQVLECEQRDIDVLCEKPLASNLKDTKRMIDKCRGIRFGVMLQRRFFPNTIATKAAIESLGKINNVSLSFSCHKTPEFYNTWRGKKISGGGVLLSQALHRLDLLVYFFGEYKSINGISKTTRDYIEVEDYVDATLTFKNGVTASIIADNSSGDSATKSIIKIEGTKGQITLSDDKTPRWNVKGIPKPLEAENPIPIKYRPLYYGPCHEMVINDFIASINIGYQPTIKAEDSLEAMKIIFEFYKKVKE